MAIAKLDVVNDCIATMGQLPLDSIDALFGHGAVALSLLNRTTTEVLATGWWFNTLQVTLKPHAATGEIIIPGDVITFTPDLLDYQLIGGRVWSTSKETYAIAGNVSGSVIKSIEWDRLPVQAQSYIAVLTVHKFLKNFDTSTLRAQQASAEVEEAYKALRAAHVRASRTNMLSTGYGGLWKHYRRFGKPYRG